MTHQLAVDYPSERLAARVQRIIIPADAVSAGALAQEIQTAAEPDLSPAWPQSTKGEVHLMLTRCGSRVLSSG